ncbi:MAG: tRNA lysidine(34) synthetase TilS [Cytophagaceae bacterium]|nr:tRNA lysidine(34) synthetase TilS [Cytophagaceae bacterium]
MLNPFLTFLNQHQLTTQRALLAVSGGVDSVVMAELFHRAGIPFGVAHCNFGLRDADSDGDEAFVRQRAERYGVPFFTKRFDTKTFAETYGLSVQLGARKLRYEWFKEILDSARFDYLATAHHRDDALETLLLNLSRGAGLAGLAGIPVWQGRVVRPLLSASREAIEQFAAENNLSWREDRSNATDDYPRNFVRHHVVPLLRQLNPNLHETLGQTLEQLAAARRLLASQAEALREVAWRREGEVHFLAIEKLRQAPEPLLLLHELLRPLGFRYRQSGAIWAAVDGPVGKQFHSPTHTLTKDRLALIVTPKLANADERFFLQKEDNFMETPDFRLRFFIQEKVQLVFENNPRQASFDADLLTFPLTLRRWQPGDWFCPLGMNGRRKKVSDLLIDTKIPRSLKARVWVLVSGESLVWVLGHRMDERFRVTPQTGRIWIGAMD